MTAHVDVCDLAPAPLTVAQAHSCSLPGNWPGLPQGSRRSHWAEERPGIRLAVVTVAAATAAEVTAVDPSPPHPRGSQGPWAALGTVGGQLVCSFPKRARACSFYTNISSGSVLGRKSLGSGSKL